MSKLRAERVAASISVDQLGRAVGRCPSWIGAVERGTAPISAEHEQVLLTAIARLARFRVTVNEALAKLTADLKLPHMETGARPPSHT